MTGEGIAAIARHVVREETFNAIVIPAIADLQFEAMHGRWPRVRAYAGAWRAVAGGVIHELQDDVRVMVSGEVPPRAVAAPILAIALQGIMFVWLFWPMNPLDRPVTFLLLFPTLVVSGLPAATLPWAVVIAREGRRGSDRAVVLLAMAGALLIFAVADQGLTRTNQGFREDVFTARGGTGTLARGASERTIVELWDRHDRESRRVIHHRLAFSLSIVGWALVGLTLAHARRRSIWTGGLTCYGVLFVVPFVALNLADPRFPVWASWIPVAMLFAVGAKVATTKSVARQGHF